MLLPETTALLRIFADRPPQPDNKKDAAKKLYRSYGFSEQAVL